MRVTVQADGCADVKSFCSVRYQVMSAMPIDYKSEANALADLIKQMST